jgi:hypothetical protein
VDLTVSIQSSMDSPSRRWSIFAIRVIAAGLMSIFFGSTLFVWCLSPWPRPKPRVEEFGPPALDYGLVMLLDFAQAVEEFNTVSD